MSGRRGPGRGVIRAGMATAERARTHDASGRTHAFRLCERRPTRSCFLSAEAPMCAPRGATPSLSLANALAPAPAPMPDPWRRNLWGLERTTSAGRPIVAWSILGRSAGAPIKPSTGTSSLARSGAIVPHRLAGRGLCRGRPSEGNALTQRSNGNHRNDWIVRTQNNDRFGARTPWRARGRNGSLDPVCVVYVTAMQMSQCTSDTIYLINTMGDRRPETFPALVSAFQ